jgi:oligopeptidase A
MSHPNPLLADDALPAFSHIHPDQVSPAIDALLAESRAGIAALTTPGAPRDFASVMLPQERLEQRIAQAWSPVSHLHSVADSEALRKVYGPAEEKLTDHALEVGQNRDLYAAVQAVADAPGFAARRQHPVGSKEPP